MVNVLMKRLVVIVGLVVGWSSSASAQSTATAQEPPATMRLSGPRVGITYLSPDVVTQIKEDFDRDVNPVISQFGWQFEKRFLTSDNGATAVTEWVTLVGGADQGLFIPSVTWLVGFRTREGVEFAAGPNASAAGMGVALVAGVTARAGNLNVPFNFAVVPSQHGPRFSFLVGFNAKRN
jgi:hypothetical protein